ncbi:MAG: DUF5372 family protein [Pseudomonadales bacterium]
MRARLSEKTPPLQPSGYAASSGLLDISGGWSQNPVHCQLAFPRPDGNRLSTTANRNSLIQTFRVTHPFHPLYQQEFELVDRRLNWGEDRVYSG